MPPTDPSLLAAAFFDARHGRRDSLVHHGGAREVCGHGRRVPRVEIAQPLHFRPHLGVFFCLLGLRSAVDVQEGKRSGSQPGTGGERTGKYDGPRTGVSFSWTFGSLAPWHFSPNGPWQVKRERGETGASWGVKGSSRDVVVHLQGGTDRGSDRG